MSIDPRLMERRRAVAEDQANRNVWRLLRFLVVLAVAAVLVWLALSPWLSVNQVRSTGIAASDAHEVLAAHQVVAGTPMVFIRSGSVENALETDPWISDARVHLNWPDEVVVRVVERVPAAWVLTAGGWVRRSSDGVALPSVSTPDASLPWVELPAVPEDEAKTSRLVLGAIEFVAVLGDDDASVHYQAGELWARVAGFDVRLGRPTEMTEKVRSLQALLDESIPPGSILVLIAPSHPAVSPPEPPAEDPGAGSTGATGSESGQGSESTGD